VSSTRPHPFSLVFGELATTRFPAVRDALAGDRRLEHFLMTPAAIELLHELRPDDGLGDAVDDFVAFVHAAYCYWDDGERTVSLEEAGVRSAMETGRRRMEDGPGHPRSPLSILDPPSSSYVQIAPRILWCQVESSEIHEPIDGWFAIPEVGATPASPVLRVVACLGLHPERPGLSVLTAVGTAPISLQRDDGSAPFAPTMEGGSAAGLHSVANTDELLWLAWQCEKQEARSEK
jgi:hypothetical protein